MFAGRMTSHPKKSEMRLTHGKRASAQRSPTSCPPFLPTFQAFVLFFISISSCAMSSPTHRYYLRSTVKTPTRPSPSSRDANGRKALENTNVDPSENIDNAPAERHAPRLQRHRTPSTLDIPRHQLGSEGNQSNGLQGGSSASSDTDVDGFNARPDHGNSSVQTDGVEAARERVAVQRQENAERIRREQRQKIFAVEAWSLRQRAEYLEWKAAELVRREMEGGASDSESGSESVATPDGDEAESQYAPTEVFSESEQQAWTTPATRQQWQQGLVLHRHHALPMEEL
ncbi:hypothetical protein BGW80DRAFT_884833 [Lactifluus volemus]|nr:hypothetical protein BGW80DRAFT_884833 [Lactifluus volemus]